MVNTRFPRSATYVTPKRSGGRVTPTKTKSAVTPAFRSRIEHLDAEHGANPRHNLLRSEDRGDADNCPDHPSPGHLADGGRDGEPDDDQDGNRRCNRQGKADQPIGAGIKWRGLCKGTCGDQEKASESPSRDCRVLIARLDNAFLH